MHRDVAGTDNGSAVLHSDFEGLGVTGYEVVALILDERVAASASHAGTVRVAAVPARVALSAVLTLRRGLCLGEGVDRGGECLDLRHQLLEAILLFHSSLRGRYERLTV
jgi:hypothetical protein